MRPISEEVMLQRGLRLGPVEPVGDRRRERWLRVHGLVVLLALSETLESGAFEAVTVGFFDFPAEVLQQQLWLFDVREHLSLFVHVVSRVDAEQAKAFGPLEGLLGAGEAQRAGRFVPDRARRFEHALRK